MQFNNMHNNGGGSNRPHNPPADVFIERPSASHSESIPAVGVNKSIGFINVPANMNAFVEAILNEEKGKSKPQQSPSTPPQPVEPTQQATVPHKVENVEKAIDIKLPDDFDFDLFQYAVLKDISCNIEKILLELNTYIEKISKHKNEIDKALSKSRLGK